MTPVDSDEDLTRKQRREQAREQRKAMEEAEAAHAMRRKRLSQLAVVGTVVVIAIVVIAVVASGGSSSKTAPPAGSKAQTTAVAAVNGTIGGIPQSGAVLGNPNAPVTLVYFGDLECPICKDFTLGALPQIIQKWVRTGKVRIEYRSLETASREPEVFKSQQIAALAAGEQNKAWYYIELFYHEQGEENSGYVTESYLQNLASQVPGLSVAKWTTDRGNQALAAQVASDAQAANNQGFNGTPSFQIGKTGGALKKLEYSSLTDPAGFNEAIETQLKG
jgi:protein-disulfide isomerase